MFSQKALESSKTMVSNKVANEETQLALLDNETSEELILTHSGNEYRIVDVNNLQKELIINPSEMKKAAMVVHNQMIADYNHYQPRITQKIDELHELNADRNDMHTQIDEQQKKIEAMSSDLDAKKKKLEAIRKQLKDIDTSTEIIPDYSQSTNIDNNKTAETVNINELKISTMQETNIEPPIDNSHDTEEFINIDSNNSQPSDNNDASPNETTSINESTINVEQKTDVKPFINSSDDDELLETFTLIKENIQRIHHFNDNERKENHIRQQPPAPAATFFTQYNPKAIKIDLMAKQARAEARRQKGHSLKHEDPEEEAIAVIASRFYTYAHPPLFSFFLHNQQKLARQIVQILLERKKRIATANKKGQVIDLQPLTLQNYITEIQKLLTAETTSYKENGTFAGLVAMTMDEVKEFRSQRAVSNYN